MKHPERLIQDQASYVLLPMPLSTQVELAPNGLPPIDLLPEWQLLQSETLASTPAAAGEYHDSDVEIKRTRCALRCLDYLRQGDEMSYKLLTAGQDPDNKLSVTQFAAEHRRVVAATADPEALWALQYEMVIHDAAKDVRLYDRMGLQHHAVDHDEAIHLLIHDPRYADIRAEVLPSLDLSTPQGKLVADLFRIKINYPQLLQGEAVTDPSQELPENLDPRALPLFVIHAKLDIAGAAGHLDEMTSMSLTAPVYRRMRNLDNALTDPASGTMQARNNAFLDREVEHFMGAVPDDLAERAHARALARLECHKRVRTQAEFDILRGHFEEMAPTARAILVHELNRSHASRATLAYYGPTLLRALEEKLGTAEALTYMAHVLQEGHIADKKARHNGESGILTVQVGDLAAALMRNEIDPRRAPIRFVPEAGGLVARTHEPSLVSVETLPLFEDASLLQGKRILLVGTGGGSDVVQAKIVADILRAQYAAEPVAIVSTRDSTPAKPRHIRNGGEWVNDVTQRITRETTPVGGWRYLEDVPLRGENPVTTYLIGTATPADVSRSVADLVALHEADVVIGIDTGGDSLYRSEHPGFSAHLPTETTPDQDFMVMQGLADLAATHPHLTSLSAVVAPGIDSPSYALDVLREIGATRLPLTTAAIQNIRRSYTEWVMDGSDVSATARFGKTPLAWLLALEGRTGLQLLKLPEHAVTTADNPWRAFIYTTPAMANIVLAPTSKHYVAINHR